jgi:hypothetical protein
MTRKKIIFRSVALALLLVVAGLCLMISLHHTDLQKTRLYDSLQKVACCSRILYLGDSTALSFNPGEKDGRSTGSMLSVYYPGLCTGSINLASANARIWLKVLQSLPAYSAVETVVVTMDIRSFGPERILNDKSAKINRDITYLDGLWVGTVKRCLMHLNVFRQKSPEAINRQLEKIQNEEILKFPFESRINTTGKWLKAYNTRYLPPEQRLKQESTAGFIRALAFNIDTLNNPRIRDYDKILAYCKSRNLNVVFLLVPEDISRIESLAGKELSYLIHTNRELLVNRYRNKGAHVVDCLQSPAPEGFYGPQYKRVAFTSAGRQTLAKRLASEISLIYPEAFIERNSIRYFTNGFEFPAGWHSEGTITTEFAHSGRHSCLINSANPYSAAFRYQLGLLDPAKNRWVKACFWSKVTDSQHLPNLIFSIENQDAGTAHWEAFPVTTHDYEDWVYNTRGFVLPDYKTGDYIKIYFTNPNPANAYIDDLKIEFPEN